MHIFESTPSTVNLYLLHLAQCGATFGKAESFLHALSFVNRFFLMPILTEDQSVLDTKKFIEKACKHVQNKKSPFGSAEVRAMFDALLSKYKKLEFIPLPEFRTFCMAVVQHKSFCRFSDISKIKLSDIIFHADYFKLHIKESKTDQAGRGTFAFVSKSKHGFLDTHMLLCVYLHRMGLDNHKEDVYLFPPLN